MSLPRLIGINGKMGAGKDTLADHLVHHFGFVKYSLAAPMKKLLNDRFGWTEKMWEDRAWKEHETKDCGARVIPSRWESYPGMTGFEREYFSPRSWAQWLGTEVGRYIGGNDVWLNMMATEWEYLNSSNEETFGSLPCMVIPDVRFENEARRIREYGGVIIRVVRSPEVVASGHVSECGISDELVNVQVTGVSGEIDAYLTEAVAALAQCPRGT